MTIQLPDHQEAALTANAQAQGVSAEEYAQQVLAQDLVTAQPPYRIWDVIADTMRSVPQEDLALLPKDGASQIDHYLYGAPKRDL